jgi:hypothetical protein
VPQKAKSAHSWARQYRLYASLASLRLYTHLFQDEALRSIDQADGLFDHLSPLGGTRHRGNTGEAPSLPLTPLPVAAAQGPTLAAALFFQAYFVTRRFRRVFPSDFAISAGE